MYTAQGAVARMPGLVVMYGYLGNKKWASVCDFGLGFGSQHSVDDVLQMVQKEDTDSRETTAHLRMCVILSRTRSMN
jgi:hypothetical protein